MKWAELPCLVQDEVCRGEKTNFLVVNGKFCKAVWSDFSSITAHSSRAGNWGKNEEARQRESERKGWTTLLPERTSL